MKLPFLVKRAKKKIVQTADGANLPMPEQPVFVVGDLHGRSDLLERMLEQIEVIIGDTGMTDPMVVFVGDMIDRGPDSAGVLTRLMDITTQYPQNVVCLKGNHEQMLIDFLKAPAARQARWLRYGGAQTCECFGLSVPGDIGTADVAIRLARDLADAIGPQMIDWVSNLGAQFSSGNLHVVHAAADPGRPMVEQSARVMIWGHPEFLNRPRGDGQWIAHGHTVMEEALFGDSRISVDTGAWTSGVLSAAFIQPGGEVSFLHTR